MCTHFVNTGVVAVDTLVVADIDTATSTPHRHQNAPAPTHRDTVVDAVAVNTVVVAADTVVAAVGGGACRKEHPRKEGDLFHDLICAAY